VQASQPLNVSKRSAAPLAIESPIEEKDSRIPLEKPSEKPNNKKLGVQAKIISNKKDEEKANNKKPIQLDKVSPETMDFVEKLLKQNEAK